MPVYFIISNLIHFERLSELSYGQLKKGTYWSFALICVSNRIAGIYLQILTRILIKDVSQFAIIFAIFALAYAGSLEFALRGEMIAEPPHDENGTLILTYPKQYTKLSLFTITRLAYSSMAIACQQWCHWWCHQYVIHFVSASFCTLTTFTS